MNSSRRNAIILILVLLIGGLAYMWPRLSFNEKDLRFPDIVKSPDVNAKFAVGTPFTLMLNDDKLSKADSIVIYLDNNRIKGLVDEYKIEVETKDLPLGHHKIGIKVYRKKSKEVELPFIVVSDISPMPMTYTKTATKPHDKKAYTQGFEIFSGVLYESGGQKGESLVRKVNLQTGQVIKSVDVDKSLFAEGLTILNDKIYQLTWQDGLCLIYDLELNLLKKTSFRSSNGEGWGLCNDGKSLIVSDGSNKLTYLNPETLGIEKTLSVYAGDQEVAYLNELEYVDGFIYANIYTTNQIAKIDAANGKVLAVSDLKDIVNENTDGEVLNGIAFSPVTKTFFITGKYWKNMYEVKFN
jgi:glutaminyl-peptide cyclotransferase